MIHFLTQRFIENYGDYKNQKVRQAYGTLCSILSIICNIVLVIFKITIGLIVHSVAIQADGLNNLSDVGSNLASLFGFKLANKHPDKDHPYGHGRYEYIAGMVIAFLILVVGIQSLKESVVKIFNPEKVMFSFVAVVILIFSILFSSNFVWNIEIREEENNKVENIMEDVNKAGLKIGESKSSIDVKEIINKVRLNRNDIAWMGIELKGTNAIVKIVKATEKPEIVPEDEYCNIVSDKDGIITKISAQNGTANVKVGDTISKGDILVNGWMEGKYTGIRYVHAKGDIQAKVWYTANKKIEYNTTEKQKTGNTETKYGIKFNNFKIIFPKRLSNFKIYDTIETEKKMKLFSDFYLPISVVKEMNEEEKEVKKTYSKETDGKAGNRPGDFIDHTYL